LLARARAIAAEHEALSSQLNDNFDLNTAKKAGELAFVATALKKWEKANEVCS
jgi:peptide chain release factor 1